MNIFLTKEQSIIVNSNCKINVGLSVPGSGKTTVLVARAERLWRDTREPILIVTFSSDACDNISKRILPEIRANVEVKTIHSFCYDIVRAYWKELNTVLGGENWPNEPKLVSKEQEISMIAELLKENAVEYYDKFEYLRTLGGTPEYLLSLFKKKVYLNQIRQSDIESFIVYERYRKSKGLITFDDMIDMAEVLIPLPYISTELSRKYSHILIDEAQDTSEQQWKILRPLVLSSVTSLVVGDYNQSIYGWRNADGSLLLNMGQMKDAVIFRLSKSFRSGSLITKLANKICYDKSSQIVPQDHLGDVKIYNFENIYQEVEFVLSKSDNDTAIISRTNGYLEKFERKCIEDQKAYLGKSFYRATHILDVYKFISQYLPENPIAAIEKVYISNISYSRTEMEDFRLICNIIQKEGLNTFLSLVEGAMSLEGPGVTLTTGHASKGLEWSNVFVVGCHTGHMPHRASTDDREERNLLYVMTSRAQNQLTITCQNQPSIYLPKELRNDSVNPYSR